MRTQVCLTLLAAAILSFPAHARPGISYFSFFNGPGLDSDRRSFTPNALGRPDDDGISFFNLVSFKYLLDPALALDLQTRFETFLGNGAGSQSFQTFRWESPRIGVSGKLLAGDQWSLSGAINTDFPYSLPAPLTGFTSRARTVIANPGTFATFRYDPRGSRVGLLAVVSPRFTFYADREAAEPQLTRGGLRPGNKPELQLAFSPTINYRVSRAASLTAGASIDYRKQVLSGWNPLRGSLRSNGSSPAWRLQPTPFMLGATYAISPALNVFPFVQAFPIAAQRIDARSGAQASLLQTSSLGFWVNGTLL